MPSPAHYINDGCQPLHKTTGGGGWGCAHGSFADRLRALADDDAAVEAAVTAITPRPPSRAAIARAVIRALADHLDGGAR